MSWQVRTVWYRVVYGDSISAENCALIRWIRLPIWQMRLEVTRRYILTTFQLRTKCPRLIKKNGRARSYLIQFAWCHRNLPLQHPSQDQRLYKLYTIVKHPAATLLSPTIPLPVHAIVPLRHISALNDAFGRFSPGLAYFALHLFRTGWNWFKYM